MNDREKLDALESEVARLKREAEAERVRRKEMRGFVLVALVLVVLVWLGWQAEKFDTETKGIVTAVFAGGFILVVIFQEQIGALWHRMRMR